MFKKKGFYYLEPFVPIEIPSYSDEEISNHLEYYKDRNWIQNPDAKTNEGKEEIIFLSGKNPTEFNRVCQAL
jgi:small subunit ribosomal protein S29